MIWKAFKRKSSWFDNGTKPGFDWGKSEILGENNQIIDCP